MAFHASGAQCEASSNRDISGRTAEPVMKNSCVCQTNLPELPYSSQGFILTLAEDDLRDTQTEMNDRLISAPNLTAEQIQKSLQLHAIYSHSFCCIDWIWNYLRFLFIPEYGSVSCNQLRERENISLVIIIKSFPKSNCPIPKSAITSDQKCTI